MSTVRRRSSLAGDDSPLEEDTAAASSTSLHFGTASPLRPSTTTTSTGVPLRGILKNGNSANSNKGPSRYREHSMSEALMESGWWKMRRRELQVQGSKFAMLLGGTVVVAWVVRSMLGRGLNTRRGSEICDALGSPGRLLYLSALWTLTHGPDRNQPNFPFDAYSAEHRVFASDPYPSHWVTLSNRTSSASLNPNDQVSFLRKKRSQPPTVLVIGDSVDRNGLVHFCQLFKRELSISHYHDINSHPPGALPADLTKGHGPKFDGWDQRGLPHICEIPFHSDTREAGTDGVAMRVVNGFHYGMDALDEFNTPDHTDWHKPGRVEDRLEKLIVPFIEQLGGLDKIDVALFGMQDDKTKWSLTVPLTPDQLAWWQERMRQTIRHVRWLFPRARVVYRKLHRTDDAVAGMQYFTNYYYLLYWCRRVNQLRHLQEEVARSEGLPLFDFGHLLEGYQHFQEKVHPVLIPGGVMYAQNLIHQLGLALNDPRNWRNRKLGSGWGQSVLRGVVN
ncbi:BZ3500_MvSof-1268-A1-R1_Chr8-1g09872 [Microbotryum saponariae]|uniref:BZ3500_MvSof-1268-A1-R1_Chr8-1g09872 protein n=1 Tax=Microbotryum saponariae TaxID=289078 RepID=A0A2X0LRN8_9BASI|nr:BZ3500_MvSof-1268-A1-R1_Chr8-1g09872 [Microbotryum saponariae]SDA08158.1 BZ3501_MvSof-1269-A2-R1_Chr8-1g09595 [Microbotryum saponariae]